MDLKDLFEKVGSTVIGGLAVAEFNAEASRIASWLTKFAVSRAPKILRERLSEEWAAYLEDTPGKIGKIIAALGFIYTSASLTFSRTISILIKIVLFGILNPKIVFYIYRFCRNFPSSARKCRGAGWDIPWSPLELGWKALLDHYKGAEAAKMSDELKPLLAWAMANQMNFLALIQMATGEKVSYLFTLKVRGSLSIE